MKRVDLSVIILSYNTKDLLRDCLRFVFATELNHCNVQVIVVDNASSDDSVQMVKKEFFQVELIQSRRNLGFSGGNNLGLKKAVGRYVLFLNSDTEVFPQAFTEMISFMDKNPKVGASTPKTLLFSGKMDPDCHRGFPTPWASICYFFGLERLFPKSKIFGQYHKFYLDLNKIHEIDAGFGTFMFLRREVLEKVGNWDESYFFYGEDLDLFYRIKKAGWKVIFYPEVLLYHHKGASSGLRKESKDVARADYRTRIKTAKASVSAMEVFYKKFYKNKYPKLLTFIVLLGIRVKGFFRIVCHCLKK